LQGLKKKIPKTKPRDKHAKRKSFCKSKRTYVFFEFGEGGKYPSPLYTPRTIPPELLKAHQKLDKAVDNCYRPQPFPQERNRIEFLFELYEAYTALLLQEEKKVEKRKKRERKKK
jgi:hypothetical protein